MGRTIEFGGRKRLLQMPDSPRHLPHGVRSQAEMVLPYSDFYANYSIVLLTIPCQTHYTSLTKTASAEHVVQFRLPHLFGHLQKLGYSLCKTITGTFDDLGSILSGMEAPFARQNLSILSIPCCTTTETAGKTSLPRCV